LLDVLWGKPKPYMPTPKVKIQQPNRVLLLPNVAIIVFLCTASLVGRALGSTAHPLIYILAATLVVASIILIWTDLREFPAPYTRSYKRKRLPVYGESYTSGHRGAF